MSRRDNQARFRATHRLELRASHAAYDATHREEKRAYRVAHREEKRAYDAAHSAKYRATHLDEKRASSRAHYIANRERLLAQSRAWRLAHPEQRRAIKAAYYAAHREDAVSKLRARRRADPAWARAFAVNRRARMAGAVGSHTALEWREKCAMFNNFCFYCGEAKPLSRDHLVPLCRGGPNDISNIVPACKSCNSRKGRRTAWEYFERRAVAA